jgi:Na+/melibiose symporter-like transporter
MFTPIGRIAPSTIAPRRLMWRSMAGWWPSAQRPGSGIRAEGSSYSLLSFTRKAGQGAGGGLAAFSIGLGGYISGAATRPPRR